MPVCVRTQIIWIGVDIRCKEEISRRNDAAQTAFSHKYFRMLVHASRTEERHRMDNAISLEPGDARHSSHVLYACSVGIIATDPPCPGSKLHKEDNKLLVLTCNDIEPMRVELHSSDVSTAYFHHRQQVCTYITRKYHRQPFL